MLALYKVFFEIAFLIFLGFFIRKKRIIDDRSQTGLTNILMSIVLPFNIFVSSQMDFDPTFVKAMIAVACAAVCYFVCGLILLRNVLHKTTNELENKERTVTIMMSIFANTGFVGFPLMQSLFGNSGLFLAVVYNLVFNLFFYTYGMYNLSNGKVETKNTILNPVTIASVLSIVLFLIPFRFPVVVTDFASLVGDMMVPLSMILVGSTLATVDIKKVFAGKKSYFVIAMRLLIFPLIMLCAVLAIRHFFYFKPVTATTIVMMTALPCGSMNVILSEKYDCAPKFAARTFFLSIVFMAVTLPIVMMACTYFFPPV